MSLSEAELQGLAPVGSIWDLREVDISYKEIVKAIEYSHSRFTPIFDIRWYRSKRGIIVICDSISQDEILVGVAVNDFLLYAYGVRSPYLTRRGALFVTRLPDFPGFRNLIKVPGVIHDLDGPSMDEIADARDMIDALNRRHECQR